MKKKLKGITNLFAFTLIELMAVIVILAIVSLIAVPIILDVVDETKLSAGKSTANMIYNGINSYCASEDMKYQLDNNYKRICTSSMTIEDIKTMVNLGNAEIIEVIYNDKIIWLKIKVNGYFFSLKDNVMVEGDYDNPYDDSNQPIINSIINNKYFNINSNGENAQETTDGINAAIKYANENKIQNIKLEKGTYSIIGYSEGENFGGIKLLSNIYFDLNGSTIIQISNDKSKYSNIIMKDLENVKLFNGILIGDKDSHTYVNYELGDTHEWGHGVNVLGSNNVEIYGLEIYNMTGDGIYLAGGSKNENSTNVSVHDCNIYYNRRQGISIISADMINIYKNKIHDISGTKPAAGIDLESNNEEEKINNIKIYENEFYNFENDVAISLIRYVYDVEIYSNIITNGNINANDTRNLLNIHDNNLKNSSIQLLSSDGNISVGYYLNNLIVEKNEIETGDILIQGANQFNVSNNVVKNGYIGAADCSGEMFNNNVVNTTGIQRQFAYALDSIRESGSYTLKHSGNEAEGNFKEVYSIDYKYYTLNEITN